MDDNGDTRYCVHGLRCVMCDGGRIIQLANQSRVTLKCAACGYVFSVIKVIEADGTVRPWVSEVCRKPPFLLGVM